MQPLGSKILVFAGLMVAALAAVLRQLNVRGGHATDLSDFRLGVLVGIGIGLILLGLWRHRRDSRRNLTP
jgi:uncharacterized membrane protein YidH (DUF202 family)